MAARLKEFYNKEVVPALMKRLGVSRTPWPCRGS